MQFTGIPWATLGWVGGLALGLITLLYILKLRKRRIEVPFSPLWNSILVEHKQHTDLWRRLRRLLSWLLQILIACLIIFAVADPHMENEVVDGRHILLLIDSSASMGATDVSGGADRLDVAKQKAHDILKTMGPDDRVMLVNFNNQLQPLSPFVSEASILEQPLRDIDVVATGTSYAEALAFAADSLRDKPSAELVIISDGAGLDPKELEAFEVGEKTTVRQLKVGESADNLAIVAFNVRRYVANKLDYELFVRVQSFFDRAVNAEIEIYADDRLVDSKPISLAPNETFQKFYPSQAVSGEKLEARIRVISSDARDVFPMDDRAYALLPKLKQTSVQVVTDGNLYIEGPLIMNPNLNVKSITLDQYDPAVPVDVTIFDRVAPKTPDSGNFFYIAPQGDDSPWEIKGESADPIITRVSKNHPLVRWITLKDVNIGATQKMKLSNKDKVVASSALGIPILVTRNEGSKKLVGLSFDIRNSDLPLRVAFPVLLINLVDYFAFGEDGLVQNYASGNTWSVGVKKDVELVKVVDPKGTESKAPVYDGRAVFYGKYAGVYTIGGDEIDEFQLAANLSNPVESQIAPIDIELGENAVVRDTDALIFERRELWVWAVLLAMLILMIEWWSYNRRKTV